jgi:hypothetical protein
MPRKSPLLSAKVVENLREDGRYAVGGADGLCLYVRNGRRYWVLRVTDSTGARREIGLGRYLRGANEEGRDNKSRTLESAREEARALRKQIALGVDPVAERRAEKARIKLGGTKGATFRECALACIESMRAGWKNTKHAAQWQATLDSYASHTGRNARKRH